MKKYFANCTTPEELKKAFRKAALETHPDHGGSNEAFKAMQKEYEEASERVARAAYRKQYTKQSQSTGSEESESSTKAGQDGTRSAEDFMKEQADFAKVILALLELDGLTLEICGNWLWITGNTYPHREALKGTGCRFSKKKKAWYWHADGYHVKKHRAMSLDEIRLMHGSELIKGTREANKRLSA